jgi:integrase
MRGSVREKRVGYWEVRIDAGIDRLTGKRVQVSRSVSGSRRDAEKVLNTLISKHETASVGGSTTATFGGLLVAWLDHAEGDLAYHTVVGYKRLIKTHIEPGLGAIKLRKLDVATLDSFYRALTKKGLASATVRQAHAIIRSALKQGVRWDWIPVNVAEKASPPRLRNAVTRPPQPVEVALLIERASVGKYPEFATMIHLAVITGARRGELCGLRWSDVDDKRAELLIQRSIYETTERTILEKDTKTHQARRIALDKGTMRELARHRKWMESRAEFCAVTLDAKAFVFSDQERGIEPWRPDRVTLAFRRLCIELEIPGIRFHDLRHFAATNLLSAGIDVRTVSGRLGHANASTTLGTYAHFVGAADRSAADVLGSFVKRANILQQ